MQADFVIVGAGAAGSVLAGRLASAGSSVALIESGPRDTNPLHRIPKGFFFTHSGNRYAYHYKTEAIAGSSRHETWTRGKVVGGSTTINGMMYLRGQSEDFNALATTSGEGHWSWDNAARAYSEIEDHVLGAGGGRGVGGPVGVSVQQHGDALSETIIDAISGQGVARVTDINEQSDRERVGYTPSTIARGVRTTPARSILLPQVRAGRVQLLTGASAMSLAFTGRRASGVNIVARNGSRQTIFATREVILCAGTIETVLLLERSGVGRPDVLSRADIPVRVHSPGVGENVIEHHGVSLQARLRGKQGMTTKLNSPVKQMLQGTGYLMTRSGPLATPVYDVTALLKSHDDASRPDIQSVWVPIALQPGRKSMKPAKHAGLRCFSYQIHPTSTGTIHIREDATTEPRICPRYFSTDRDRATAPSLLDNAHRVLTESPLADLVAEIEWPGGDADELDPVERALNFGTTVYHAVGSARMGRSADDPLDGELRVRGAEGLRVVDASALPFQLSGNTAAPVMALAWLAGELIPQT